MVAYDILKNRVYEKYFLNNFLPSKLGGQDNTTIFNLLLAIESVIELQENEVANSRVWCGSGVTWFTPKLKDLFSIPKFSGESDGIFLNRILTLTDNSQNDTTIISAVHTVIPNAVANINAIEIIYKLSGVSATWGNATSTSAWGDGKVWSSEDDVQRVLFVVKMNFNSRGATTDNTTYDYWINSSNYTKIEDMVNLYKPPGSTFELLLNNLLVKDEASLASYSLIN